MSTLKTSLTAETTAMPTTGQFHPGGSGHASAGGSCAQLGQTMYYLVPDSSRKLKAVSCNISDLVVNDNVQSVKDSSNWGEKYLKYEITNHNSANLVMNGDISPSGIVVEDKLYFFWQDSHNSGTLYAAYMDAGGNWSPSTYICKTSAGTLKISSCISANNINGTLVLNYFDTGTHQLRTLVFDPAKIDHSDLTWTGTTRTSLDPNAFGLNVDSKYYRISTTWFSHGAQGNYMVAAFYSTSSYKCQFLLYTLDDDLNPIANSDYTQTITSIDCRRGVTLCQEPSGRIMLLTCTTNAKNVQFATLPTFIDLSTPGKNLDLNWSERSYLNGIEKDSEKNVIPFFVMSQNYQDTELLLQPKKGAEEEKAAMSAATYLFAMYCDSDSHKKGYHIQCQLSQWGTSYSVPDYNNMTPQNPYHYTMGLIMDSFPFPNENIGDTAPGNKVVSYTYGTSNQTTSNVSTEWNFQFGIKGSLSTDTGVGPAAETSFSTGPEGGFSKSSQDTISRGWTMDTAIIDNSGTKEVSPKGRFDGQTMYSVTESVALWYDGLNKLINGDESPLFSSLKPVPGRESFPTSGTYDVFCATPGDINSYTESEINQAMKDLYDAQPKDVQDSYFTPGYASNYIIDVIEENCIELSGGKKFLEFTVERNGGSNSEFEHIDEETLTMGWLVNGSAYAGLGFGAGLSIFGVGEEISGSLMVGYSYGLEVKGGVGASSQWGVTSDYNYLDEVPGSYHYSVRMYLCKPDNMWAREVQYMGENVEDKDEVEFASSAPMKIMFVVLGIKPNT